MPGLVDIRGHLREPESLASIGEAAAFGGYTTIAYAMVVHRRINQEPYT